MEHIVSISGGLSSAVAADRVMKRYGADQVTLWFADTLWEDEDLYRFLDDLEVYWGKKIIRVKEGRTPLKVADDQNIIPNNFLAPCSHELKIEPFVRYIKDLPRPLTVHIGLDWTEVHRMVAPQKRYEGMPGVSIEFPLMWEPIENRPYGDVVKEWGIKIPRLYCFGFSHNNCSGMCVRQGKLEWWRLLVHFPERFAFMEEWESERRKKHPNNAICMITEGKKRRPITLTELRKRLDEYVLDNPTYVEDRYACFCSY